MNDKDKLTLLNIMIGMDFGWDTPTPVIFVANNKPLTHFLEEEEELNDEIREFLNQLRNDVKKIEKLVPFEEALKALKEGKKVRRSTWKEGAFIKVQLPDKYSKMTAKYIYFTKNEYKTPWRVTPAELLENDWIILEDKNEN